MADLSKILHLNINGGDDVGVIEDIVKIVDQVVEEKFNDFIDDQESPQNKSTKTTYKKNSNHKNIKHDEDALDLDIGEEEKWLDEFDNIIKEAESVETRVPAASGTIEVKKSLSLKPTTVLIIGGGLLALGLAAGVSTMVIRKRSVKQSTFTTLPVRSLPDENTSVEKPKVKTGSYRYQVLRPMF